MESEADASTSLRRGVAAALLLVVGVSAVSVLQPGAVSRRWRLLGRSLSGERTAPELTQGFAFDPDYSAFLQDVRRRTPADATVAIVLPEATDLYVYQAAYQLAPRRVVEAKRESEASFVATYRGTPSGYAGQTGIAHGTLVTR
jgi:hypothetical protein